MLLIIYMSRRVFLSLLALSVFGVRSQSQNYGYLSHCPGADKPLVLTDTYINSSITFKVQVNNAQIYRKTYYFRDAIQGIGNDPNIDFKNKKTVVYMPGYMDSTSFILSRLAVLGYPGEQYNAITFESLTLYSLIFPLAARSARQVGNLTAQLLIGLHQYGLKSEDIEIFGYSLGAQAASFAAKNYYKLRGKKVSKITGVDPSGPCFRNDPNNSLQQNDADFVQVIHATGQGFGTDHAVGHVDFYLNGGDFQYVFHPYQPWCDEVCGHTAALAFHHSALINPDKFIGVRCQNVQQAREHKCFENTPIATNVMGSNVDINKTGIFYVPIAPYPPFYPNEDIVKTKRNYQEVYDDSLNNVDHFVLSQASGAFSVSRFIHSY